MGLPRNSSVNQAPQGVMSPISQDNGRLWMTVLQTQPGVTPTAASEPSLLGSLSGARQGWGDGRRFQIWEEGWQGVSGGGVALIGLCPSHSVPLFPI